MPTEDQLFKYPRLWRTFLIHPSTPTSKETTWEVYKLPHEEKNESLVSSKHWDTVYQGKESSKEILAYESSIPLPVPCAFYFLSTPVPRGTSYFHLCIPTPDVSDDSPPQARWVTQSLLLISTLFIGSAGFSGLLG